MVGHPAYLIEYSNHRNGVLLVNHAYLYRTIYWIEGFKCNKRCKCNFLVCMFAYHKHFQCTYITYWVKILFEGSFGEKMFSTKNSRNNMCIPLLYVEM